MFNRLVRPFTSLKLTVTLLALGGTLIFWGTLAQVHLGLYDAQNEFFRSFFIYRHLGNLKIPIFPGGYLIGSLLLINLFAAHLRYYQPGKRKFGIAAIHLGVVLLLLGQFATDMLSTESTMHLRNGETKNFSEADRVYELAVVEDSAEPVSKVVVIPEWLLRTGGDISHPEIPFTIRIKAYFDNSTVTETNRAGFIPIAANTGIGAGMFWCELPRETAMERRDIPSGLVEVVTPSGPLGTWFVSGFLLRAQDVVVNGKHYEVSLRPKRIYKPFSIHLVSFTHEIYPGTDIPKNFSSRVRVIRPDTGENREVLIYMNSPLRYAGETYYQYQFDPDDGGTVLQVVRNPGWLTPYLACLLVAGGLVYQFLSHLFKFIRRRNA